VLLSFWFAPPNNSLDASGRSVFLNYLDAAKGALIRAAASTQPLGAPTFRQGRSDTGGGPQKVQRALAAIKQLADESR